MIKVNQCLEPRWLSQIQVFIRAPNHKCKASCRDSSILRHYASTVNPYLMTEPDKVELNALAEHLNLYFELEDDYLVKPFLQTLGTMFTMFSAQRRYSIMLCLKSLLQFLSFLQDSAQCSRSKSLCNMPHHGLLCSQGPTKLVHSVVIVLCQMHIW